MHSILKSRSVAGQDFAPPLSAARRLLISSVKEAQERAMLSSALQYLDERRKRFQRADTAPLIHLSSSATPAVEEAGDSEPPTEAETVRSLRRSPPATAETPKSAARMVRKSPAKRRCSTPPLRLKNRVQVSPESSRKNPFRKTLSLERRSSLDNGAKEEVGRGKLHPKTLQFGRSQKFSKLSFVRQLKRYNSARTIEDLKKEWGSAQRAMRDTSELFQAIERADLGAVRMILEKVPELLHSCNEFDLYPLDMAMLRSRGKVAEYLISIGASNNPNFFDCKVLGDHLSFLLDHHEKRQAELAQRYRDGSATQKVEKECARLDQTSAYLRQLKASVSRMGLPSMPSKLSLDVVSSNCVRVTVAPPVDCTVTKFKLEWSSCPQFESVDGEEILSVKLPQTATEVVDLQRGRCYHFRAAALNMKGWGEYRISTPSSAALISWRDDKEAAPVRYEPAAEELAAVKCQLEELSKDWLSAKGNRGKLARTKSPKLQRKRSFKHLFFNGVKFTRNPRSGVFLGLMCHSENKVLIHEDQLPYMFVDEVQSFASLQGDVMWLLRFLSNQAEIRPMRDQLSKMGMPSRLNFRMALLSCLLELQAALGLEDVRVVYPEIVRRHDAAIVVLVKEVTEPKELTLFGGLKWTSLGKVLKKSSTASSLSSESMSRESSSVSLTHEEDTCVDDYLKFSTSWERRLERGLYIAYVRLNCQVDYLELMVPRDRPSLPPVEKIRDNPDVTLEELQTFRRSLDSLGAPAMTVFQSKFRKSFLRAWSNLCEQLEVGCDEASEARVFTDEVVEISPDVSLILVFPSIDQVCMAPGTEYLLPSDDFTFIPLRFQEALSSMAYERESCARQAALSSCLEMLLPVAQQSQREAFSNAEMVESKARVDRLAQLQARVEAVSARRRWLVEAITCAREKGTGRMAPLATLLFTPATSDCLSCCPEESEAECTLSVRSPSSLASPGIVKEFVGSCRASEEESVPAMGTMRLFAEYPTGLTEGTSVKLFLTSKTTVREILYLVVRQLNMAGQLKSASSPVYSAESMGRFQLVGVKCDGAEVPIPCDLRPLLLDSSWKTARFCIRLKTDL